MIIVLNKDDFNFEKIEIQDIIPNSIIEGGYFNRFIYNDDLFSTNGIFIKLNFKVLKTESYFNKFKLYFLKDKNTEIINYILGLESDILSYYNFRDFTPVYRIKEQINNNLLKALYLNNSKITENDIQKLDLNDMDIILKISGIWSNNNKYGLTFRFFLPAC